MRSTIVIGYGNSILTDDAVGLHVARHLKSTLAQVPEVHVEELEGSPVDLLLALADHDRAIIVDAMQSTAAAGTLTRQVFRPDGGEGSGRPRGEHDVNFAALLATGKQAGLSLPAEVVVYGVAVADPFVLGEALTPDLASAVPRISQEILQQEFPDT